jgi:catechol 2,3-dioxygenase-like lactoylglutathione lyase family enzyme
MNEDLSKLFQAFDRGRLSRRQLLQALGFAVAVRPAAALAQAGGRGGRNTAPRDTTPAKLPFESTGWKTVLLDHFTCEVEDYSKEAAYYNALMNWAIRSDDGKQAVLDIGEWGGLILKGGYKAPPPTAAEQAAEQARAQRASGGRQRPPRPPRNARFNNVCWGIAPWNAKTVEAELRKRGLDPVADNRAGGFESFHIKDPDGFDLQISNGNRQNRRQTPAHGKTSAPAPFGHTSWKTIWLDHISYEVPDYKKTVAFYQALLGWKPGTDEGNQNQVQAGDVGDLIIRTFNRPGQPPPHGANIGHIAFGITPFDPDEVKEGLEKRGLTARVDTGGRGDIHTAAFKSYHTTTPNGFDLQISSTTKATRTPPPPPPRGSGD